MCARSKELIITTSAIVLSSGEIFSLVLLVVLVSWTLNSSLVRAIFRGFDLALILCLNLSLQSECGPPKWPVNEM